MAKAKQFTPAVGFFKSGRKTRPITARKQSKLRIVRRVVTPGYPYTTPRQVKPMLANRGSEADLDRPDYVAQRKYDGTRVIVIRDGDRVILRGRSWKNDFADRYPDLVEAIRRFPHKRFVADAELTFFKKGTDEDVMLTALARPETQKKYDLKLMFFDILYLGKEDLTRRTVEERFDILKVLVPKRLKKVEVVELVAQNQERFYKEIVKKGGEGVMLKRLGSLYQEHARNNDWLKVKKTQTDEAIVLGYTRGNGVRSGTFGSLILGKPDGKGGFRLVGEAGTGFKEKELKAIRRRLKSLETKKRQVDESITDVEAWVKPELVVEVKFHELSKNKKYRHPSFIRIRDDKTPDEVT